MRLRHFTLVDKMKVLLLAAMVLSVLLGATFASRCIRDNSNGEPGCKTKEEIDQGFWRHNYDPTRYWECTRLNEPAVLRSCQDQAFHPSQLECVDWDDWEWEPVCAPLTRPDA
uniref:Chitin-binding type-2 domain-containing protein n=1 Tax=Anopheles farauti TaxID=69004 RepID=A0A182Q730_9DIPT